MTEGLEAERDPDIPQQKMPREQLTRELLKADKRVAEMLKVPKALLLQVCFSHLVTSPAALLELIEWHAESAIKNIAAGAAGAKSVQRMGKKAVGDLQIED